MKIILKLGKIEKISHWYKNHNFFLVRVHSHGRQWLRQTVSCVNIISILMQPNHEMKSLLLPHHVNTPIRFFVNCQCCIVIFLQFRSLFAPFDVSKCRIRYQWVLEDKISRLQTFFLKIFGGYESFLWGHWYPCFGLLVISPLGFKARVGNLIRAWWRRMHYTFPEIHLWCDTCWPLGSQHGNRAISSTYLQGIGGTQTQELTVWDQAGQTLYRLSYPSSAQGYRLCWSCYFVIAQLNEASNTGIVV